MSHTRLSGKLTQFRDCQKSPELTYTEAKRDSDLKDHHTIWITIPMT